MKQACRFLLSGIIIILLSGLGAGCATEPTPSTKSAHIKARQGIKVPAGSYAVFRGLGCLSGPSADINIITQPQHGRVTVESEDVKIETISSGNPRCIGSSVRGKVVYYISDSNYIGEDSFSYIVFSPQVPWSASNVSIVVDVYP